MLAKNRRKMNIRIILLSVLVLLLACQGCGLAVRGTEKALTGLVNSELFRQGRHGKLNEQEIEWAKTAWQYFVNNHHADTGLTSGLEGSDVVSVWNIADAIAAAVAAHHFGFIDEYEFDHRISPLLGFLNKMSLHKGKLPNLFYRADSGTMTDRNGEERSVGWSAVDIGRLLIWLQILRSRAPQYAEYIDKAVLRWEFCEVIDDCGGLHGMNRNSGTDPPSSFPKEPLGYQDYALMGYASWGFPRPKPLTVKPPGVRIYNLELSQSKEDSRTTGSSNPLVTMPYMLLGLEFNWDRIDDQASLDSFSSDAEAAEMARRIYAVQEQRYRLERIFTARNERRQAEKPSILYDSIFADGYAWNTVTPEGETQPETALVSTAAAFGMWALWKTSYTEGLMQLISPLHDPERGWFEGRREKDGAHDRTLSSSTNAAVLEALLYKAEGKLYHATQPRSHADMMLEDEFRRPACSPPERQNCWKNNKEEK